MARFAKEIIVTPGADYNLASVAASYTPAATDKIIITPVDYSTHQGNVKIWLIWGSGTWKAKLSDSLYAGKFCVVIKT